MGLYSPNIPQPTDVLAYSQLDMLNNFKEINNQYGLNGDSNLNVGDHVELNETQDDRIGLHKKTTLVVQGSDPSLSATESAMFCKNVTQSELFYKRFGDASASQLTGQGRLSNNGLVLRALVCFDGTGKIIDTERVDQSGNPVNVPIL